MSKAKEVELKPCPFRGKPGYQRVGRLGDSETRTYCINVKCHVQPGVWGSTPAISARRWNTRKGEK